MDSAAGWTLGYAVAAYMQRLAVKTPINGVYFNAAEFQPVLDDSAGADFFLSDKPEMINDNSADALKTEATLNSSVINKLWVEAQKEWQ